MKEWRESEKKMKVTDRTATIEPPVESPQAIRWEYCSKAMDLDADLSQYGFEGWELVAVVSIPHDPSKAVFHFKRRRS